MLCLMRFRILSEGLDLVSSVDIVVPILSTCGERRTSSVSECASGLASEKGK